MLQVRSRFRLPSRSFVFLLITLLATTTIEVAGGGPARADYANNIANLGQAVGAPGVAWDGSKMWVLGGMTSMSRSTNAIQSFDPITKTTATSSRVLPAAVSYAPAVYTGQYIYQFGGDSSGEASTRTIDTIVRFDPVTGVTPTVIAARLPVRASAMAAVWTGQYVYLLGGLNYNNKVLNSIWRFDPTTESLTLMPTVLPFARWASSAVWDGSQVVMFGGRQNYLYDQTSQILTYNPASGAIAVKRSQMPYFATAAIWDGYNALVFGGATHSGGYCEHCAYEYNYIYKYKPSTDTISRMSGYLPRSLETIGAVYDGRSVWLAGGYYTQYSENCGSYGCSWHYVPLASITQYNLAPASPTNVMALPALAPTKWTIQWSPPSAATYSAPITAYKIYKSYSAGPGGYGGTPYAVVAGNTYSFTDSCALGPNVCYYAVSAETAQGEGPKSSNAYSVGTSYGY